MSNSILESEKQIKLMNRATDKQIAYIKGMKKSLERHGEYSKDLPKVLDFQNMNKQKAHELINQLEPIYKELCIEISTGYGDPAIYD